MPVDLSTEWSGEADSWPGLDATHSALAERLSAAGEQLLNASGMGARELSLMLTDDARIRALNGQWRGQDKATDVLSFPLDEGDAMATPPGMAPPLGDIVISVETCGAEADKVGQTLEEMSIFLLVHGFCHLLGHDHAEPEEAAQMREDEDRLLAAVAPDQKRPPTPY